MSGSTESTLTTCLTCKKRLLAREMAYIIGQQTAHEGLGLCEDCVKAETKFSDYYDDH